MLTKEEILEQAFRAIHGLAPKRAAVHPPTPEHEKVHLAEVYNEAPAATPEEVAPNLQAPGCPARQRLDVRGTWADIRH
jgi:hypothetical protein